MSLNIDLFNRNVTLSSLKLVTPRVGCGHLWFLTLSSAHYDKILKYFFISARTLTENRNCVRYTVCWQQVGFKYQFKLINFHQIVKLNNLNIEFLCNSLFPNFQDKLQKVLLCPLTVTNWDDNVRELVQLLSFFGTTCSKCQLRINLILGHPSKLRNICVSLCYMNFQFKYIL